MWKRLAQCLVHHERSVDFFFSNQNHGVYYLLGLGQMINCFTFESCVVTFMGSSVLGTRINNDDKIEHVVLKEFAV